MTTPAITLVYDGDCPVCRNYTQHLSIKQAAGTFELLNARDNPPIVQEINALNLDMDEGFVLKIGDRFYHGADAIHTLGSPEHRNRGVQQDELPGFQVKNLVEVSVSDTQNRPGNAVGAARKQQAEQSWKPGVSKNHRNDIRNAITRRLCVRRAPQPYANAQQ